MAMKRSMMLLPSFARLLLVSCATEPRSGTVFSSDGDSRNLNLRFSLGPEKEGLSTVRVSGAFLRSAIVSGEAMREGEAWRIGFYPLFRSLP
jgi:hypothetical protein